MKNQKEQITIDDLRGFYGDLRSKPKDKWIFRGEDCSCQANDDLDDALKTSLDKSFEQFGLKNHQDKHKAEIDVIRSFQRKLHLYMDNLPTRADITQWLAIMQHHGAPTRLLDWTYSFWIAVHFATARRKPGQCARVWAVNTKAIFAKQKRLEERIQKTWKGKPKKADLPYGDRDAIRDNGLIHYLLRKANAEPGVYAVTGFRLNERVTIQQGTFLAPGDITKSFHKNLSNTVPADDIQNFDFKVTKSLKLELAKNLRQMNISNAVLFPGLDGFSQSLWMRVGIPAKDKLSLEDKYLSLWP
ncbi:MAG: FRG domain-containing protein [Planctomycetota bacterium]|jgi:hypothetical protein